MSRRPGEGRYAQLEREQRWLMKEVPSDASDERVIVDHYWTGTTLRLRMIQHGEKTVYKLCQKVRLQPAEPELVKITNIYLGRKEFQILSITPSSIVSKSRWTSVSNGVRYAIDEFKGRHVGLVLAERELGADEARCHGPELAIAEVTDNNEYSGGWLAVASERDLERVIAQDGRV